MRYRSCKITLRLTEDELAMLSRYTYNNFDENFAIHKCSIFSAKIDDGTQFHYGMNTIFEGAYLSHATSYELFEDEEPIYKYVVSYVERPSESGSLADVNLFVQLYSWLTLAFKVRYIAIAVMIRTVWKSYISLLLP